MKPKWEITEADVKKVQTFVKSMKNDAFVKERHRRNIEAPRPEITKDNVWYVMVGCLLTTQQRSGPGRPVNLFLNQTPFPLRYSICRDKEDVATYVSKTINDFKGIRFETKIGIFSKKNLELLEHGEWQRLLDYVENVKDAFDFKMERDAAHYVDRTFNGFGPKQSRNLLQWLGVSKYEIPVDSRITKWLNKNLLEFKLNAGALANREYYDFVSDGIITLCERAGMYPCVLDAAIFSSFDKGAWNDALINSERLTGA
jgi:hypothetical protein